VSERVCILLELDSRERTILVPPTPPTQHNTTQQHDSMAADSLRIRPAQLEDVAALTQIVNWAYRGMPDASARGCTSAFVRSFDRSFEID